MAEFATIARPYAEALFHLASSHDIVEWDTILSELENFFLHPDIKNLVNSPGISAQKVSGIFLSLLGPSLPELMQNEVRNLITILTKNGRLIIFPEIYRQFQILKNIQQGTTNAKITSAFEMSESQVNELVINLERKFNRKLNPTITVDHSLIGGVRIVVNDEVLDASISTSLREMCDALVV